MLSLSNLTVRRRDRDSRRHRAPHSSGSHCRAGRAAGSLPAGPQPHLPLGTPGCGTLQPAGRPAFGSPLACCGSQLSQLREAKRRGLGGSLPTDPVGRLCCPPPPHPKEHKGVEGRCQNPSSSFSLSSPNEICCAEETAWLKHKIPIDAGRPKLLRSGPVAPPSHRNAAPCGLTRCLTGLQHQQKSPLKGSFNMTEEMGPHGTAPAS